MDLRFLNDYFLGNPIKNYLMFLGVLFLAFLFRKLFSRWISVLVYKGLDKLSQDLSVQHFIEMLIAPLQKLITYIFVYFAVHQIDYPLHEPIFRFKKTSITYGDFLDKIFLFLIVWSFFKVFFKIIDFVAEVFEYKASLTESKNDDQLVPFIKELVKVLVYIIEFFVILGTVFNVNVATLIAGFGIGGVALALAAKESLENLIGSFTIFLDKPFLVGDLVRVDNIEGTIEKVGFRSTRLRTMDNSLLTLPNKKLVDGVLDNLTLRNYRRVKFSLAFASDTPSDVVKKTSEEILNYLNNHPKTNAEAVVNFDAFGDFSLNVQVIYFIEMMAYGPYSIVKEEINYKILDILQQNKAELAFPVYKLLDITPKEKA